MSGKKLVKQHNYLCILLDYYGDLLTQRRQQILNMSLEDDMSLSEIAEKLEISRQAVHDNIQQAVEQLQQYERNLGMVQKDQSLVKKVDHILSNYKFEQKSEIVRELEELKEMIL
ncbi:MAG: HTH domain-containing protein [Clostridiaceae bacterium]|nr:HTH domain-containing protein [Clostridiaceae bacterium]